MPASKYVFTGRRAHRAARTRFDQKAFARNPPGSPWQRHETKSLSPPRTIFCGEHGSARRSGARLAGAGAPLNALAEHRRTALWHVESQDVNDELFRYAVAGM